MHMQNLSGSRVIISILNLLLQLYFFSCYMLISDSIFFFFVIHIEELNEALSSTNYQEKKIKNVTHDSHAHILSRFLGYITCPKNICTNRGANE